LLVAALAAALLLLAAPRAHGFVYWTNFGNADRTTIVREDNDGLNINTDFITGANAPCGIAVDQAHVCWANYGMSNGASSIGRAELDGGNPSQSFIPLTASAVCGIAVDIAHLYWTATGHGTGGAMGEADLAGTNPNEPFNPGHGPCGVAINTNNLFGANNGDGTIGRSDRFGGNAQQNFVPSNPGSAPCGIDASDTYVYWANFNSGTIGRAQLDGSDVWGRTSFRAQQSGAAADQLESTRSVRVSVVVSFVPTGGDESVKTKRITLLLKS
jgi:virginiamycin B lyase